MSEKYKFKDPEGMYFITMSIVDWVDLFTRPELKHLIVDSLKYCQEQKGLVIHAWCIMPSHLHLIVSSVGDSLSVIMRDFKKFTSKKVIEEIDRINESRKEWLLKMFADAGKDLKRIKNYKIWQDGNHPELLVTPKFMQQKLDYLHYNPVAAEIVDEPWEYRYSSARDYCAERKGFLDIKFIE